LNPPEGATIFPNLSELENVVPHEDLDATDLLHDVTRNEILAEPNTKLVIFL